LNLFSQQQAEHKRSAQPLAARMRPRTLDQFVGQQHFLGTGRLLRRMLHADQITSLIFFGPPSCGKTTLARIIAYQTKRRFAYLNAASSGVKELRSELESARAQLETAGNRTILFIDELHHFNRTQQDTLLPDVEEGVVSLIAATTLNPFFSLVSPLVSRSQLFQFEPLNEDDIFQLLSRSLADVEQGLGRYQISATDEALKFLAEICDGDARRALNALEIGVLSIKDTRQEFDLKSAEESIQKKAIPYSAHGDEHYDAISAFIKSMRGSDPDATVYWLARMLEGGEDPRYIARRLVIHAAEDVGNADPQALVLAQATAQAVEYLGMPESRIPLAQAALYIATAPKSNSAILAIDAAMADVRQHRVQPVPKHLRDAHYSGARQLGHGEGYQYPHNHSDGYVKQEYLGIEKSYYMPTDRGYEEVISRYLKSLQSDS